MRYYLDCEFNGHGGELLSLALVRDDLMDHFYAVAKYDARKLHPWVKKNVHPFMDKVLPSITILRYNEPAELARMIETFLSRDNDPVIVTDWPDDIAYFCRAVITKPGEMVSGIPSLKFEMRRVDAYPTRLADAVQHNAWWDAVALRQKLIDIAEGQK